jgi:nucleotide-binding universal stress UspA family protein
MPAIDKHPEIQLDSVVFATDFSPASYNAGLYASAVSVHFGTHLVVAHAFILIQAALEVEAEKPLASKQRINLNHDLMLMAEVLESGRGTTESVLVEGDPCRVIPILAQQRSPGLVVLGTHGGGSIDRYVLAPPPKECFVIRAGPRSPSARMWIYSARGITNQADSLRD